MEVERAEPGSVLEVRAVASNHCHLEVLILVFHTERPESVIARLRNRLVASLCTALAPGFGKFLNQIIFSKQCVQQRTGSIYGDRERRRGAKRSGIPPWIVEMGNYLRINLHERFSTESFKEKILVINPQYSHESEKSNATSLRQARRRQCSNQCSVACNFMLAFFPGKPFRRDYLSEF